ncbi:MAG: hypothetical protein KJP09_10570 [Bacteroidia bacterium]|nr:hypothetical protein [Bacteroidia bacterium]NNK26891.1 hypothetical protein [Flavobacteriaceae bacterium]
MEAFFIYLMKSAGILIIFFLAYKLFLQKETFFNLNRHFLLGGILASLVLPLVVFTSYIYVEPTVSFDNSLLMNVPLELVEKESVEQSAPFDWLTLLIKIYLIGVVAFMLHFIIQLLSLYRLIRSGKLTKSKGFNMIEVSENISPFSFFNYIIYNSNSYSVKDLKIILNHEKAHGRQLHSLDILITQLFATLLWVNPIVWLYKKDIQQNLEFLADKSAVSKLPSKKNYQHTLLKVSVAPYCTSITNNFYNSLIKKRIVMLNQSTSKTRNLWKYTLILPALALFLMSFNTETVEIVKESEPVIPASYEFFYSAQSSNSALPIFENSMPTLGNTEGIVQRNFGPASFVEIIVKITKDTTKEELDKIRLDMKEKGVEIKFSDIDYNSDGEITSIRIKYNDKDSENSGVYHVKGDDDDPIETILIQTKENGGFSIGNANRDKIHVIRMKEHEERMHEREHKMKERNERIKHEHEVRLEEHKERMEEHKAQMEDRKARMKEEHEVRIIELKERHEKMKGEHEERINEHKQLREEHRAKMMEEREERRMKRKDKDSNRFVYVVRNTGKSNGKPLYVVDGDIVKEEIIVTLDKDKIESMNVLKGDSAIEVYGDEGKDGVIKIVTKGSGENHFTEHNLTALTVKINKASTKEIFNKYVKVLAKDNIDLKFSKIRRDKNGNITRIKIDLDDNKGNKTSSTYNTAPEAIPEIIIGKKNSKLTITKGY